MSLPDALERAASELAADADSIRPANGDPDRLLEVLDADAAVRVLAWVLAHEAEAAGELAEAWAEHEAGAVALASIADGDLPKAARKILRRARHRARSRGMAVPEEAPAPHVATLPSIDEALSAAYVSPILPMGPRAVSVIESQPAGGVRLVQVVIDARRGIVECELLQASRKQARKLIRDLEAGGRLSVVAAPRDSVRALIARAVAAQPADRPLPRSFNECRRQLVEGVEDAKTPGEIVREALSGAESADGVRRAVELVRSRAIGPWIPAPEPLREVAEKLDEVHESKIVVSGAAKREQIASVIDEALPVVYDEAERARTAEILAETAYVLWKQDREDDARACLAAAAEITDSPVNESSLARALLEAALAPILEKIQQEGPEGSEPEESSLLVKP